MKKLHLTLFIVTILTLLYSCNKEVIKADEPEPEKEIIKIPDGTYFGEFSVQYPGNISKFGNVTIVFNGAQYNCTTGINYIPRGGSGTYTNTNDTINFIFPYAYTADFDPNLILQGKYRYTLNGNNLVLYFSNGSALYKYNVEKVAATTN